MDSPVLSQSRWLLFSRRNQDECHGIIHKLTCQGIHIQRIHVIHIPFISLTDRIIVIPVILVRILSLFHEIGHISIKMKGIILSISKEQIFSLRFLQIIKSSYTLGCLLHMFHKSLYI